MMQTLFLGGTIGNDYRERLTKTLVEQGVRPEQIFNPVVKHWDQTAQQREDEKKADSSVLMLYYLCADEAGNFLSFYSLHEAEMGLYDEPTRTALVFDYEGMVPRATKRLYKVYKDLKVRFPEAPLFESIDDATIWLLAKLK